MGRGDVLPSDTSPRSGSSQTQTQSTVLEHGTGASPPGRNSERVIIGRATRKEES